MCIITHVQYVHACYCTLRSYWRTGSLSWTLHRKEVSCLHGKCTLANTYVWHCIILTANAFRCTCTRAHLTRNHSGVGSDSSIQIERAKYNVYSQGKSIVLLSSHSSSHTCKYACVLYIRLSYPPSFTTGKRVWKLWPELRDHRCPLLENGVKRVWPMQYIHVYVLTLFIGLVGWCVWGNAESKPRYLNFTVLLE